MSEKIFAVIIPDEADLTVPLAAATELSKIAIKLMEKITQLEQQTRIIRTVGADGMEQITIIDNPDLKWWVSETRKALVDIAKLTVGVQQKTTDQKIQLIDLFMRSKTIPKDLQEQYVKYVAESKVISSNDKS
jgi:hypothetical protein